MQTLISTEPTLYAEWKETLNIDQAATGNPAALSLNVSVDSGQILVVNYEDFSMENKSEIILMNGNDSSIEYGFGPDELTFNDTPTAVGRQSQERKTASSLGYHSIDNNSLNIRNNASETLSVTLEFYDMS